MQKPYRYAIFMLLCAFFLSFSAPAHAKTLSAHVVIDGEILDSPIRLADGVIRVPIRTFAEKTGGCIYWDAESATAYFTGRTGRYPFSETRTSQIHDNVLYVPIRELAKVQDMTVTWDEQTRTANLESRDTDVSDELLWLARIICAEACAEPMEGKIAVGNVVLNRVASDEFPDTIYGVIFDRKYGVQFEPVLNGTVYCDPDSSCMEAAKRALAGENVVGGSLYFFNPELAQSTWISDNRDFYTSIGGHDFYL